METRGVIRIDSSFGDIANIGLHINMIFIIMYYNFMNERKNYSTSIINIFIPFLFFSLIMFSQINHGTSFGVFVFINVLFLIMRFLKIVLVL